MIRVTHVLPAVVFAGVLLGAGVTGTTADAQKRSAPSQHSAPTTLVFDGVTVIDVEGGKALPDQRVVIQGNRILDVSPAKNVILPRGAQVIDAKGKYLIPGLWDMRVHPGRATEVFYPLLLANGVTGFLDDAGSPVPPDTLRRWRQDILAGTRVGPVRQLFVGLSIRGTDNYGVKLTDQQLGERNCQSTQWDSTSYVKQVEVCQQDSRTDRNDNEWFVAMFAHTEELRGPAADTVFTLLNKLAEAFWNGTVHSGIWLHDSMAVQHSRAPGSGLFGAMTMAQETHLPVIAGTGADDSLLRTVPPGFSLQAELAMMVAEGATPLTALRSATMNPVRALWMGDSLGTVSPGKLADLVLLDANPLDDITNITMVRAVVANGRYYDRAVLDHLLTGVQANAKTGVGSLGNGR